MLPMRLAVRRMSHLAARYTGRGDVHVVDPSVDLRYVFDDVDKLRRSLEERRCNINITDVKTNYEKWWEKFEAWKASGHLPKEQVANAKREMRHEQDGLLAALSLPNFVHEVGTTEKDMLRKSHHQQYLTQKGHMRVDNDAAVVYLRGYPVLLQDYLKRYFLDTFSNAVLVSPSCFARAAVLEAVNVPLQDFLRFTDGSETFPSTFLAALLDEELCLSLKARQVMGKELRNYESKAIVIEDDGLELARISRIGDYISRRLNTVVDSGEFVRMVYVETDIDRVLSRLIDGFIQGEDVPKILRDLVRAEDFV
ncbi:unnamed protein product [Nippostrongylus brasiliensis]|uniref:Uncharacterized protein n=1 Tax=Nippostrongylus brasiliensis TaxID=27835 RepID=A0A0N4YFN5_NIPBR|nr:unnamed protein product [Nippostrongylus brasiliensis]